MKKYYFYCVAILFIYMLLSSCNNREGEGGMGVIEGNIQLVLHPNDNYLLETDTISAAKTDVFIVYGDDSFYGDDIETDSRGNYRFKYLNKGTYTIFAYSILSTGEKIAETKTINIERGETITVPTIYIHEGKAFGTSMIKGQIWANYIHNGANQGAGWAYEHRVYIRKVGEPFHFDDVRVGIDGYFFFQELLPGDYEVFTITEDENEVPNVISQFISITETNVIVELNQLFTVQINV